MADEQEETIAEYLSDQEVFRRNAFILITTMVDLNNQTEKDTSMLVEEILHNLFFRGLTNSPPFSPRDLLADDEILDSLEKEYPAPFKLYSTQLPRRSHFSCLLDMVVNLYGQENQDLIIDKLQDVVRQMKERPRRKKKKHSQILFSSTICISQTPNSGRYYGVSMSTQGRPAGQILVAASCFSYWNRFVSDAVMTYYPDKQEKKFFSRNIKLPSYVKCEAFNISDRMPKAPCKSCSDLFGLVKTESNGWPHGACAEVESLSNLFYQEQQVIEQLTPEANVPEENRKRAETRVYNHLKQELKKFDRFNWDGKFFQPQPKQ